VTTTSVQNSTNSLRSGILADNSIQTGANAGPATSFLVALEFHELLAASVNISPASKPASETTPSKNSESEDSSLARSVAASYLVTGVQAMPVQATLNVQSAQSATRAGIASTYPFRGAPEASLEAAPLEAEPKIETIPLSTQGSTDSRQAAISTSSDSSSNLNPNGDEPLQIPGQLSALFAFPMTEGPPIPRLQQSTQSVNNLTAGLSQPTALNGSQSRKNSTPEGSTSSSRTTSGQSGYISVQSSQRVDTVPIQPIPPDPLLTNSAEPAESPRFSGIERQLADRNNAGSDETQISTTWDDTASASVNFSPTSKSANETTPSKSSESEVSSLAQSAAASYLVTGVQAMPKVSLQSVEAAPLEAEPKIETIPLSTRGSTDSRPAAISTSSDSSSNLNPNGDEPLQIPAQLFSSALFAFPTAEGPTISRFQESTQPVNNLTAGLRQPTALDASQSRKNSTTEGSTSSSRTSGQSGNISVQSLPIELLQPVDAVPTQPIPSDSSLANSAEPAESPRSSGIERQLADRNNAGSDETQISTTRDDTASPDPIAFEAKISSPAAAGNFNEKTAPDPNSPIPTVARQVDPVESVGAAEVKPEGLSPSASAAMDSFSGTPSGDTKRPTATAPETPITAQLDRLLESERHAESNQPISVNLTSTADGPVSVRFVERSGEVHVTVRTADPVLAQDLRSGLSDLSGRLEHAGFRAEVSSQSGTDPNLRRDSEQASPDSRNSGRQNPQPQRQPDDPPPDRRNPHTSKFAASVNNLIKEQDA
jgi:hypothetical protein